MDDNNNSHKLHSQFWFWFVIALFLNLILLFAIMYFSEHAHQWTSKKTERKPQQPQPPRIMKIYKQKKISPPKGSANKPVPAVPPQKKPMPQRTPPKKQKAQEADKKIKKAETPKKSAVRKENSKKAAMPVAKTPKREDKPVKRKRLHEQKAINPTMPSLADFANGFLSHQKQQEQRAVGISNGNINGDLAAMKYASYFKTLKKHLQTALNIHMGKISTQERNMLMQKQLPQTVFFLEWDRNGKIVHMRLTQSSTNQFHDALAKEILLSVMPLPAIPPSLKINTFSIPWGFGLTPGHASDMNAVPTSFNYT
ncbi:MAG TPA: TonB C-terminal domain-containing protein [Candidatus Babeliales bacterium]|nr:TonB C-terminal domain-containing protein [Candidatus Babeliales bacterium]